MKLSYSLLLFHSFGGLVEREVIVTLESIVAKHNETNQAVGEIQRVASNADYRSDLERNRMNLTPGIRVIALGSILSFVVVPLSVLVLLLCN